MVAPQGGLKRVVSRRSALTARARAGRTSPSGQRAAGPMGTASTPATEGRPMPYCPPPTTPHLPTVLLAGSGGRATKVGTGSSHGDLSQNRTIPKHPTTNALWTAYGNPASDPRGIGDKNAQPHAPAHPNLEASCLHSTRRTSLSDKLRGHVRRAAFGGRGAARRCLVPLRGAARGLLVPARASFAGLTLQAHCAPRLIFMHASSHALGQTGTTT